MRVSVVGDGELVLVMNPPPSLAGSAARHVTVVDLVPAAVQSGTGGVSTPRNLSFMVEISAGTLRTKTQAQDDSKKLEIPHLGFQFETDTQIVIDKTSWFHSI